MRIFLGVPDHAHTYSETFIESVPQEDPRPDTVLCNKSPEGLLDIILF